MWSVPAWGLEDRSVNEFQNSDPSNVRTLPLPVGAADLSDALGKLIGELRSHAPADAAVTLLFDGRLHINIDVRNLDDVARLEFLLPALCGGIFSNVQRGLVDKHPFLHRLTALVAR
jgi:hypothetical protein